MHTTKHVANCFHPFVLMQCIKRMVSKGSTPVLTLVTKGSVDVDYPREEYYLPSLPKREKPRANGMLNTSKQSECIAVVLSAIKAKSH